MIIVPKAKYRTKQDWFNWFLNNLMVAAGDLVLAFGTAIFLRQLSIVQGGLSGVGLIIQYYVGDAFEVVDIVVAVGSVALWLVGFFFVGKDFAFKTLLSSILFPVFLAIFLRVDLFVSLAKEASGDGTITNVLICAIFAGIFLGIGVALTFLGGGSSGGVDVLIALLNKKLGIKESLASVLIDGTIILVSMFLMPGNFVRSLCGVISASLSALMIEFVFISNQSSFQADIISSKWADISKYVQDKLGRGATIIKAQGGYKGEERIILRVVFDKSQYEKLRRYIAYIDPKAFVTYTQTNAVYGEGFKKH